MLLESKFDLGQLAYVITRNPHNPTVPEIEQGIISIISAVRDSKGDTAIRIAVKSFISTRIYPRSENTVFNTKQEAEQAIVNRNLGL